MDLRSAAQQRPAVWFFTLNLAAIWATFALTFGSVYPLVYLFAAGVLALVYGPFRRASSFGRRWLLFYLAFLLLSWSFTLASIPREAEQLTSLEAIAGMLLRGFAYVAFAHLFGFVLLTLPVAGINYFLFRPSTSGS